MGGAVSAGEDNDDLIDNLIDAEYIKSPSVEKIFRAVDRKDYYLEGCKESAYRDLAWKHGNIHLSAPCIYSEVMESLRLRPGMSFLNLGSGTGYLSTMAGLLLGPYGTNHGVELHEDVVDYARNKLEEFQASSPALDKYEFCPPQFVVGNCLLLDTSSPQYDRVYCGASCPIEHENYMKNLIRVGGILVMPLNDHLHRITRTSETTYESVSVLPVSFASLVEPELKHNFSPVKLPETHPWPLSELCRTTVRNILRKNIELENPTILERKRISKPRNKRSKRNVGRIVIPLFDQEESEASNIGLEEPPVVEDPRIVRSNIGLRYWPRRPSNTDNNSRSDQGEASATTADNNNNGHRLQNGNAQPPTVGDTDRRSKIVVNFSFEPLLQVSDTDGQTCSEDQQGSDNEDPEMEVENTPECSSRNTEQSNCRVLRKRMPLDNSPDNADSGMDVGNNTPECSTQNTERPSWYALRRKSLDNTRGNRDSGIDNVSDDSVLEERPLPRITRSLSSGNLPAINSEDCKRTLERFRQTRASNSREDPRRNWAYLKRSAEDDADDEDDHGDYSGDRCRSGLRLFRGGSTVIFKRVALSDDSDDFDEVEDSDSGADYMPSKQDEQVFLLTYTYFMKQKILQLPLPQTLKHFMNFSRPFDK